MGPFSKNFDFNIQEGIIKKISFERRAYESADEKSLSSEVFRVIGEYLSQIDSQYRVKLTLNIESN